MSAVRMRKNYVAPSLAVGSIHSRASIPAAKLFGHATAGNPTTLQRTIYKSGKAWVVEYRVWPDKKWNKVYHGGSKSEAEAIYKGLKSNPTHHFPRLEGKGRPGTRRTPKPLIEEVFPGMRKGRPRINAYWKADLYGPHGFIETIIGQGSQQSAMHEASSFIGKIYNNQEIYRVELKGPYSDLDAMEADLPDDEIEVKKTSTIRPPAPKKSKKIKVIPIADIPRELATPKRGRGRPRKHAISSKFKVGQKVQDRKSGAIGIVQSLASGPHMGTVYVNFNGYQHAKHESELTGLRGRPRKSDIHSAVTLRP